MKKILIISVILLSLTSCKSKNDSKDEVIDSDNYKIIDVRTKEEYEENHIKGSINIPLSEISTIDINKDTKIYVYCKSGARSKKASEILKNLGYQVIDLGKMDNIDLEKINS